MGRQVTQGLMGLLDNIQTANMNHFLRSYF